MKRPELVDAEARHRERPGTFQVPSLKDRHQLDQGDYAKVCFSDERFWVLVSEVHSWGYVGVVSNDLGCEGLDLDDVMAFEPRHIYQIQRKGGPVLDHDEPEPGWNARDVCEGGNHL